MIDQKLRESVDYLMSNGYIEEIKGKYRFTPKFNEAITQTEPVTDLVHRLLPATTRDWETLYTDFIIAAKVPRQLESSDGGMYDCNKYSEEGLKAFRRMLEKEGVVLQVLTKSTMLYYKSGSRMKRAIGNYISKGLWRTDYEAMLQSVNDGTLAEHIKSELHAPGFTRNKLG